MDVELVGANQHAQVITEEQQEYVQRYYNISGRKFGEPKQTQAGIEVHSYNKITYKNIYPEIDWVIFTKDNQVEYEFVVREGGNPTDIKIRYTGATSLKMNADGSMTASTPMGTVTEAAPYSYQEDGQKVNSSFSLNNNVLTFNVSAYSGTLVIDPIVYWGTYFGSTGDEEYNSVAQHWDGPVFAVGATTSISNMATVGAIQITSAGLQDAFITSFDDDGTLLWSTYYGSAGNEYLNSVSINGFDGFVYAVGTTDAGGTADVVFASFTTSGQLNYDAVIGDALVGGDEGYSVECSNLDGAIYFCGMSTSATAMATLNSYQSANAGGQDGFLTKVSLLGNVEWSTYYGGPGNENLAAVNVDFAGDIYGVGTTNSLTGISQLSAYNGGNYDVYVNQFAPTGTLYWGDYWGGTGDDIAYGADADLNFGGLVVTGSTTSTAISNITSGALQPTNAGGTDAFYWHLGGPATFYGGSGFDAGYTISWMVGSHVRWGGYTEGGLLYTSGGFQPTYAGNGDGFMIWHTPNTVGFGYSSYYGGPGTDVINSLKIGWGYATYAVGNTTSASGIAVNTTVQNNISAGIDAFITRIEECPNLPQPLNFTGPTPVCAGTTQTYSVDPVLGAIGYTWTLPNGWTGTSDSNSITVVVGPTSGNISVTADNACGTSSPPATQNVTVLTAPTATITPAGPTTFCQGGSVVLNANTGIGYSYQWYNGTTPVGTNSSTYTASSSGSYTVVVSAGGCSTTSAAVTVTNTPTPSTPVAGANTPICAGSTLNLTAFSSTPGVTYDWTGPNNFSNTQNPSIPGATLSDAGAYSVTATLNGCVSAAGTVNVVITSGPPAQPGTITGSASVCAGSNQSYTIAAVTGATGYTWTFPTGWTPGTTTTTTGTATAGTTGGNVTVTANNACGSSTAQTLAVTVIPAPTATITAAGPTTFCQGGNVVLNANTGTGLTYQWYNGTTLIPGATNPSYTANTSGSYTVVVSDGSCGTTSAAVNVTVNPLPTPTITQNVNTLSTTNTYTTYQWYLNGNVIPGATNQTYNATQNGDYYVVVTDGNGCTAQSNTIQLTVSVSTVNGGGTISLYPNPNDGNFSVKGAFTTNDGKVNIQVTDVAGRIVYSEQVTVKNNTINTQINMNTNLAAGIYTLKLGSDVANVVIPFVKK